MEHKELHTLPELKPIPTVYTIEAGDELYCIYNGFVKITQVHRDSQGLSCAIAVEAVGNKGQVIYTDELKVAKAHLHQSLFYTPSQSINYFMRQPYMQVSSGQALITMRNFDSVILSDECGDIDIVTNGSSRWKDTIFSIIRNTSKARLYREIAMRIRDNQRDLENGRR